MAFLMACLVIFVRILRKDDEKRARGRPDFLRERGRETIVQKAVDENQRAAPKRRQMRGKP